MSIAPCRTTSPFTSRRLTRPAVRPFAFPREVGSTTQDACAPSAGPAARRPPVNGKATALSGKRRRRGQVPIRPSATMPRSAVRSRLPRKRPKASPVAGCSSRRAWCGSESSRRRSRPHCRRPRGAILIGCRPAMTAAHPAAARQRDGVLWYVVTSYSFLDCAGPCREPFFSARRPLQVGRPLQHHPRHAHVDDRHLDHADRPARRLSRHPPRPAAARQQLLPSLADPQLSGRHGRAGRQPRPPRRHLRPRTHVQPGLCPLHVLLAAAHGHLDARQRGRHLAGRHAHLPGRRRSLPAG